jgi:hypothetical protein
MSEVPVLRFKGEDIYMSPPKKPRWFLWGLFLILFALALSSPFLAGLVVLATRK